MAIEKSITVETKDVGPGREKKNKRFYRFAEPHN